MDLTRSVETGTTFPARGGSMQTLWQWQGADVRRLVREGKNEIVECWKQLVSKGPKRALCRKGVSVSRKLGEQHWELFFRLWELQQGIFREPQPALGLLALAREAVTLADSPGCAQYPERFCIYDSLLAVYQLLDPVGYADEILRVSNQIKQDKSMCATCRGCFETTSIMALQARGDHNSAFDQSIRAIGDAQNDNQLFIAELLCATSALAMDDLNAAHEAMRHAEQMNKPGHHLNDDSTWFLLEARALLAIAENDRPAILPAARLAAKKIPHGAVEYVRTCLAVARSLSADESLGDPIPWAVRAFEAANDRDMAHSACEAALLLLAALPRTRKQLRTKCVESLKRLRTQLQSNDLDMRIDAALSR